MAALASPTATTTPVGFPMRLMPSGWEYLVPNIRPAFRRGVLNLVFETRQGTRSVSNATKAVDSGAYGRSWSKT